jgi:hypothetical protein
MSLICVRPGHPMGAGANRLALYAPLSQAATFTGSATLSQLVAGLAGWWDASVPAGLAGIGATPLPVWTEAATSIIDLSGNGRNLLPYYTTATAVPAAGSPHLSGLLGGAGFPSPAAGLLQPALDPTSGWQLQSDLTAGTAWSVYLVWSRPNWRQGTNADANPISLLTVGGQPVLQADSKGGASRLVLFPGSNTPAILSGAMTRRHTHSILIRYSPTGGADVWLDNAQVARAVAPGSAPAGATLLLHDGTLQGAAQCWLHEAAIWNRSLSDTDAASVVSYASRWNRGARKGIYLLFNGQSNAINYTLNDGAAALLARGVAWYLGALAYNVLATTGGSSSYTMQSGHGLYAVSSAGYPGSFVADPGDGSSPAGWALGADGLADRQAIAALPAEDIADICAIVWPWNETDSLRQYGELQTFQAAALRFLSLTRAMLGDTANRIPLIWWNAIPYGSADGISMHRQVVKTLASQADANVFIGNTQTSDRNPRGSNWNPATGIATGGDSSHRDTADNRRFAMLAAPVVAKALEAGGFGDTLAMLPSGLPRAGGPSIVHAYRQSNTVLIVTIAHDAGTDLIVPLQASNGAGFAVMDGGAPGNAGSIVNATACQRLDATHLQITLAAALQNASPACHLYYPYGPQQIGRGNAVTDNFSAISPPAGWNPGSDLGSSWSLNFPLAATFTGIPLSDTPA